MIDKYENQTLVEIAKLLKEDKVTFSVLSSILAFPCKLIITDRKYFIICYTCSPYPVWIWTHDDITNEVYESVCSIINKEFGKDDNFFFNVKYNFLEYLKTKDKVNEWYATKNMLTYDCPNPKPPSKQVRGAISLVAVEDYDIVRQFIKGFFEVTSEQNITQEEFEEISQFHINSGNLYLWKDDCGFAVAMCGIELGDELGKVKLVYTPPTARRKGYASSLVYEVSCMIKEKGLMPILYTDGDYNASNECYKAIGYVERGCLCSITRK